MDSDRYHVADAEVRMRAYAHGIGVVLVAFLVAGLIADLAFRAVGLAGVSLNRDAIPVQVGGSALQYLSFLAVGIGYLLHYGERDLVDWTWPDLRDVGWIVGGFVALYALLTVIGVLFSVLELQNAEHNLITRGQQNPDLFLYMIPVTLLLVAPGEELIFRGIVQGLFTRAYGVVPAIVLASALFGAVHVAAVAGGGASTGQVLLTLASTAALGAILGAVYELSENLLVATIVHGLWNTMTFLTQWLAATNGFQLPT